jgi:hypothetical protein
MQSFYNKFKIYFSNNLVEISLKFKHELKYNKILESVLNCVSLYLYIYRKNFFINTFSSCASLIAIPLREYSAFL